MRSSTTDQQQETTTQTGAEVVMPQMGVSVAEGTIAGWLVAVGDEIAGDEPICEVTTDKIDIEIPAPTSGVLTEILVEEGATVPVGTPLARIGETAAAAPGDGADAGPEPEPDADPPEIDRSEFVSPVVRRIAAEHDVDLGRVEGHGIGGRVRKRDLLEHLAEHPAAEPPEEHRHGNGNGAPLLHSDSPYRPDPEPQAEGGAGAGDLAELIGPVRHEPLDPMRRAIASHMSASRRTAAHCTTVVEADFGAVTHARAARKEDFARRGVPLTYLAFVAQATVESLAELPILNASFDAEREEIVYHDDVNLGIAVALEDGLVVPVIRKAQRLSLEGLAAAIADLAKRARGGDLAPDDLAGGTFTITNPGQFGAVLATPIIHQPQVAILDLEAIVRRPVVIEGADGTESIGIRPMSYLCMSWDHRALDGAIAARFLGSLQARLEAWGSLMSGGFEEVAVERGPRSGATMAVAVHSTRLGPALGGARIWHYPDSDAAIADAMRLAESMTHKAAAAGLDLGGGKGVISTPREARPEGELRRALLLDFGDLVDSLEGRYVTAEDVGSGAEDMDVIAERTAHVVGRNGGSGDPSPVTALGVRAAIRACLADRFGSPDPAGRHIVIVGLGHVGTALAELFAADRASLTVTDVNPGRRPAAERLGARWVEPVEALGSSCDVLAPCALGGLIDERSVEKLGCEIVCGAANNVLAGAAQADLLAARGILYAPDFIANAGGLMSVYGELKGIDHGAMLSLAAGIERTMTEILRAAERAGVTPLAAARQRSEARLGGSLVRAAD